MPEQVVVDASVVVDLLVGSSSAVATALAERLRSTEWHAPAHLDLEVLSALGRWERGERLDAAGVEVRLGLFLGLNVRRHELSTLLPGAWARRSQLRLADALYVELSERLGAPLITTDRRLGRAAPTAEVVDL